MKVAGVDEVGRGCLAGPVVAAAVILPEQYQNREIRDSKLVAAKKRELLDAIIKRDAIAWSIIAVGPREIEKINIREASRLAMKLAVEEINPDFVLVDGNTKIDVSIPQQTIIGGDRLKIQISAASIIAKVWRDKLMNRMDQEFPGYGFSAHVGYPTKMHKAAISTLGITSIHRKTFAGVAEFS